MLRDELTIVVQGPIYEEQGGSSWDVLRSYRRVFPKAPIVLSTWEGERIDAPALAEIGNIRIILNKDPGPDFTGAGNINLNRQIISTRSGVEAATTRYVLKTRTDARIDSDLFLHFYKLHLEFQPRGFIFEQPLAIYSLSTRNWRKGFIPHLFHPCDWFYFGLTSDVASLFSIPLMSAEDLQYFSGKPKPRRPSFCGEARYTPEQYILVAYMKLRGLLADGDFDDYAVNSTKMRELNEKIFRCDFLVLDERQLDIFSWKYPEPHSFNIQISQLRHAEWVEYLQIKHMPFYRAGWVVRKWTVFRSRVASLIGIYRFWANK